MGERQHRLRAGALAAMPDEIQAAVRNNAGGHANHSLFWELMSPDGGGEPEGELKAAIDDLWGSTDALKQAINDAGVKRFGSGWTWLIWDGTGLAVKSTPNQDSPVLDSDVPLLGIDVWEHAYYLNYQNRRPDYLAAWWNVVNWDEVAAVRAGRAGALRPARSSPAAPASSAPRSRSGCAARDGACSPPGAATATSRAPTMPARSSPGQRRSSAASTSSSTAPRPASRRRRFEDVTEEDVDRALGATVKGSFFVTQAAVPHLRESRGLVVMLEDVAAYQPWPSFAAHGAAKAAQAMLTRTLAKALAPEIRVCGIAPGPVALEHGDDEARRAAETALRRVGSPDDVAGAILYLAGAGFVTGTTIAVDGGRLLQTGSSGHA